MDAVEDRRGKMRGKSLPETGYEYKKVAILRALPANMTTFDSMSYVTRSNRFAKEHAEHMAVTEGEDYHVIRALVNSKDVYEAPNPGEYFYDGPPVTGQRVYLAKTEE